MQQELLAKTVDNLVSIRKQLLSEDGVVQNIAFMRLGDLIGDLRRAQRAQTRPLNLRRFHPNTQAAYSVTRDD